MTKLTQEYLESLKGYAEKYEMVKRAENSFWDHAKECSSLTNYCEKKESLVKMMDDRLQQYELTGELAFFELASKCYKAAVSLERKYSLK